MKKICIAGTGGFAREVLFLIDEIGAFNQVRAFIEPNQIWDKKWKDKSIMGLPVLPYSDISSSTDELCIAIGDPAIRRKTISQLPGDAKYVSLIHPNASVSKWTELGNGCIITAGCVVTTQIIIGAHCHLNLNTTIGHDCRIEDFFTTAPSVNISGNCIIGNQVYFGNGSATRQGITICDDVVVGMGAMVVKDINEPGTYVGIPAKKFK